MSKDIMSLTHDTHKGIMWLDDIQKKQIPFATSLALNRTAAIVRDAMIANTGKKLTLRNSWTEKGWGIKASTKSNLHAIIGHYDPYMVKQEEGGNIDKTKRINRKEQSQGKSSFIPKAVISSKNEIVKKSLYPSKILKKKKLYFLGKTKTGRHAIYRRDPGNKLKLMMLFIKEVKVKPILDFDKTSNAIAIKKYPVLFEQAFEQAMATAKR